MRIRRLLSEPLLHFLLLGGALFAIYGWMATGRSGDNQIVGLFPQPGGPR